MRNIDRLSALAVMLGLAGFAGMAGAQAPAKVPPATAQPVAAQAATPDVCYTAYGLTPKQKAHLLPM